ncbi:MAG: elongator complex protein 3 [Candidatus Dojkabacteria bacterium]
MDKYAFAPEQYEKELKGIFQELAAVEEITELYFHQILKRFPKDKKYLFSRDQLVRGYRYLVAQGFFEPAQRIEKSIRMKPVRTLSGVATVTVLTRPFPCPGQCIFCPNDFRMPKSYLSDEPGAQRAEKNSFDPYFQTYNRLLALDNTGHSIEKIELIVLGGTWSFYPDEYQIWFIKRCFDALNDYGVEDNRANVVTANNFAESDHNHTSKDQLAPYKKTYNAVITEMLSTGGRSLVSEYEQATWNELESAHSRNEHATCRNVGLVIETRPDYITKQELIKIRRLGATKIQIGIQSLNDNVLSMNKRGHDAQATKEAIKLIRLAGFKIHGHWMPNLYGSNVQKDIEDYQRLWEKDMSPDELKVYPTSIISNTELYNVYQQGKYKPYTHDELLEVLVATLPLTPRYCRLTRIVRDIPSPDIVAGNKLTNFRQIAEQAIMQQGRKLQDIRAREIKSQEVTFDELKLEVLNYPTCVGEEFFLSYTTKDTDQIAGFLRLCIPERSLSGSHFISELSNTAIIREIHIYGQVLGIGKKAKGESQHLGLGTKLIEQAKARARKKGFKELAVISAIGTREYYLKKGFIQGNLYMRMKITE